MQQQVCSVRTAHTEADYASFRSLTLEYYNWLNEDLCFQGIEKELQELPGAYASPSGCILLASISTAAGSGNESVDNVLVDVGAVALRMLHHCLTIDHRQPPTKASPAVVSDAQTDASSHNAPLPFTTCEMKRLFVRPAYQKQGIGKKLIEAISDVARQRGYQLMVLDTLDRLTAANSLYRQLGFEQCAAYYDNPLPGVVYWSKVM